MALERRLETHRGTVRVNKCAVTAAETTLPENGADEDPAVDRPSGCRQLSE